MKFVAGAFAGLDKIVSDRIGKRGIGFGTEVAKNDDDSAKQKRRPPAPDRSQGQGGSSEHGGAKSSVAEVMAERRAARETKK